MQNASVSNTSKLHALLEMADKMHARALNLSANSSRLNSSESINQTSNSDSSQFVKNDITPQPRQYTLSPRDHSTSEAIGETDFSEVRERSEDERESQTTSESSLDLSNIREFIDRTCKLVSQAGATQQREASEVLQSSSEDVLDVDRQNELKAESDSEVVDGIRRRSVLNEIDEHVAIILNTIGLDADALNRSDSNDDSNDSELTSKDPPIMNDQQRGFENDSPTLELVEHEGVTSLSEGKQDTVVTASDAIPSEVDIIKSRNEQQRTKLDTLRSSTHINPTQSQNRFRHLSYSIQSHNTASIDTGLQTAGKDNSSSAVETNTANNLDTSLDSEVLVNQLKQKLSIFSSPLTTNVVLTNSQPDSKLGSSKGRSKPVRTESEFEEASTDNEPIGSAASIIQSTTSNVHQSSSGNGSESPTTRLLCDSTSSASTNTMVNIHYSSSSDTSSVSTTGAKSNSTNSSKNNSNESSSTKPKHIAMSVNSSDSSVSVVHTPTALLLRSENLHDTCGSSTTESTSVHVKRIDISTDSDSSISVQQQQPKKRHSPSSSEDSIESFRGSQFTGSSTHARNDSLSDDSGPLSLELERLRRTMPTTDASVDSSLTDISCSTSTTLFEKKCRLYLMTDTSASSAISLDIRSAQPDLASMLQQIHSTSQHAPSPSHLSTLSNEVDRAHPTQMQPSAQRPSLSTPAVSGRSHRVTDNTINAPLCYFDSEHKTERRDVEIRSTSTAPTEAVNHSRENGASFSGQSTTQQRNKRIPLKKNKSITSRAQLYKSLSMLSQTGNTTLEDSNLECSGYNASFDASFAGVYRPQASPPVTTTGVKEQSADTKANAALATNSQENLLDVEQQRTLLLRLAERLGVELVPSQGQEKVNGTTADASPAPAQQKSEYATAPLQTSEPAQSVPSVIIQSQPPPRLTDPAQQSSVTVPLIQTQRQVEIEEPIATVRRHSQPSYSTRTTTRFQPRHISPPPAPKLNNVAFASTSAATPSRLSNNMEAAAVCKAPQRRELKPTASAIPMLKPSGTHPASGISLNSVKATQPPFQDYKPAQATITTEDAIRLSAATVASLLQQNLPAGTVPGPQERVTEQKNSEIDGDTQKPPFSMQLNMYGEHPPLKRIAVSLQNVNEKSNPSEQKTSKSRESSKHKKAPHRTENRDDNTQADESADTTKKTMTSTLLSTTDPSLKVEQLTCETSTDTATATTASMMTTTMTTDFTSSTYTVEDSTRTSIGQSISHNESEKRDRHRRSSSKNHSGSNTEKRRTSNKKEGNSESEKRREKKSRSDKPTRHSSSRDKTSATPVDASAGVVPVSVVEHHIHHHKHKHQYPKSSRSGKERQSTNTTVESQRSATSINDTHDYHQQQQQQQQQQQRAFNESHNIPVNHRESDLYSFPKQQHDQYYQQHAMPLETVPRTLPNYTAACYPTQPQQAQPFLYSSANNGLSSANQYQYQHQQSASSHQYLPTTVYRTAPIAAPVLVHGSVPIETTVSGRAYDLGTLTQSLRGSIDKTNPSLPPTMKLNPTVVTSGAVGGSTPSSAALNPIRDVLSRYFHQ